MNRPYIGVLPREVDCHVPAGALVCESKYCELCGCTFARERASTVEKMVAWVSVGDWGKGKVRGKSPIRVDNGQRLCERCKQAQVNLPDAVEKLEEHQRKYQEQLPNLNTIHLSSHPVKFDRSLVPPSHKASAPIKTRAKHSTREWAEKLKEQFALRGTMTYEDMCEYIPGCLTPLSAAIRVCVNPHIKIVAVGFAPRRVKWGTPPKLFALAATETIQ